MAFPVPDHLPKRSAPVDVSSKILYKISAATNETLNASLATSWVNELDESIQSTKQHIHNRIHEDLPAFNQLLVSSKGVQTQFQSIVDQVDGLHHSLSDPQEGLVPTLLDRLRTHKALVQEALDAETVYQSFSYLLKLRDSYSSLLSLSERGHLPEATLKAREVDSLIQDVPQSLHGAAVMDDLKTKFRATRSRVEDLLSDAYLQGITVTPLELVVRPVVQARNSEVSLDLSTVIRSLPAQSLANHLTTLRRDFLAHFIEHILKQPFALEAASSATHEQRLTLFPSPPNVEDPALRLQNLGQVLHFLSSYILPLFPQDEADQFARSIGNAVTNHVLELLVRPHLPSSFGLLPGFLTLLRTAVEFERTKISPLNGNNSDLAIKTWADGVSGHYERRRRVEILEQARKEILEKADFKETFLAVSNDSIETSLPSVVAVQDDTPIEEEAWGFDEPLSATPLSANPVAPETAEENQEETNGWGFNDDKEGMDAEDDAGGSQEVDSWGLDDDMEEEEPKTPEQPFPPRAATPTQAKENGPEEAADDPGDAWGWNEEEDPPTVDEGEPADDTSAWDDDPWADPPPEEEEELPPPKPALVKVPPSPVATFSSPKPATRLEKLASKQKKANGNTSAVQTPEPSPGISSTTTTPNTQTGHLHPHSASSAPRTPNNHNPPPLPTMSPSTVPSPAAPAEKPPMKRPAEVVTTIAPKEYYQVPKVIKRVVKMVEKIIDESKLFYASNLFPDAKDTNPAPGAILAQTASSILDLYEALYPIKYADDLKQPERGMLFSNGCFYVAGAIQRIEDTLYGASTLKDRLTETRKHLEILANSWFEDVIEQQQRHVDKLLSDGAQGFVFTTDQDRYDECEMAVSRVVSDIKKLAQRLDGVLTKSKYYPVLGLVTDTALSKTMQDILAIPDITEVESGRLAELCRIFNSLEGLFSTDPNQSSFIVAYVPSWLKFSYLSELLEASLADITYLVENGALVDFEMDELIGLVKALFADTQLRTNTINKIREGHMNGHA